MVDLAPALLLINVIIMIKLILTGMNLLAKREIYSIFNFIIFFSGNYSGVCKSKI